MATLVLQKPLLRAAADPGLSWTGLYRAGGAAAILFAILSVANTVVVFFLPPLPPSGGMATLEYILAHRSGYILFQTLLVGPVVLTLVTFPALYLALRQLNRSYAAIGSVLGVASVVLCLVPLSYVNGLVYLSYPYGAATSDAQRAAFASAAEGLLAQNNSVSAGGVLFAISILVISIVMLKGVFSKWVAWLGIVSGALGIICESLRPMIGGAFAIYAVILIWLIAVGWKLYRLA